MKPEILIPTCDAYIHFTEALMISCREFWPAGYTFRILGYKEPEFELDENWHFEQIGIEDWSAECWGTDMKNYMEKYQNKYFIYGNDDCALTFFNFLLFETALRFTMAGNCGRFALLADHNQNSIGSRRPEGINIFKQDMDYRLSLGWSIWDKEVFMRYLVPGDTPWDYEKQSCGIEKVDTSMFNVCGFTPKAALDAAFFARRNKGIIEDWDKGYFGHDLSPEMKPIVERIIFKK